MDQVSIVISKVLKSNHMKQYSKWYEKLYTLLVSSGYQQAHSDHSLFVKHYNGTITALLIYVDGIVLTGNSLTEMAQIKSILRSNF